MEDLVKAIKGEKPTEIKREFDKAISTKILDKIQDRKVELAKDVFNVFPPDETQSEEE